MKKTITENLKKIAVDDMTKFFEGCQHLEVPDMTRYHVSHMFDNCDKLEAANDCKF